jgi:phosphate transport system substrate-binding protein
MKFVCMLSIVLAMAATGAQAQIKGAGSSFAANLYGSWGQAVAKTDARLEYDPIGSGGGVKSIQERATDFGATDRPLSRAALEQAGLAQFPTAIGGVVVMTNIAGVASDKIKLDGAALAGIYLGQIKQWNDPALTALNPELALPAVAIVPVYRTEGSGTTFVLTSYLAKVSAPFKTAIGASSNLTVASGKGAKTSSEAASLVRSTPGAIGYFDYAYASDLALPSVQLKNQWGKFVAPSRDTLQMAMKAADWEKLLIDQDPTFEMDLTDAGCPGCWPIASVTYVLVPLKGRNVNSARVLEFFEQSIQQGDESAVKEGYVPLPGRAKNMISLAMRRWNSTLEKAGAGKPQKRTHDEERDTAVAVASL